MAVLGFANKIAHVDLAAGKVEFKPIPEEWARKYIGGRGLGVKYVFENGPKVDPLSPDDLVDAAFLRRIRYKIYIPDPTLEEFREIFKRVASGASVAYTDGALRFLDRVLRQAQAPAARGAPA